MDYGPLYMSCEFWSKFGFDCNTTELTNILNVGYKKINWKGLCLNPTEGVVIFLSQNVEMIDWSSLCKNKSIYVEDLVRKNSENIVMDSLSSNNSLWGQELMRETAERRCFVFKAELLRNRFHPDNFGKFNDWGFWHDNIV